MSAKIKLVQGDTRPQIKVVISDDTTGELVNVNGAQIRLKYRASGTDAVLATMNGVALPGRELEDGTIDTTAPYNLAGVGGRVAFQLAAAATNQDPGQYEGEIEVTFADGTIQTVYAPLKFTLRAQF